MPALNPETIVSLGASMPPSLQVYGRLGRLLEEPDSDLDAVVDVVRVDHTLTFQVIRLSNSVMYGLRHRSESLEEAVGMVGFEEIRRIVGLAAARHMIQGDLAHYPITAAQLWQNSVATAAAMSALARCAGRDTGAAYAAGLLRNVGRIVLDSVRGGAIHPGLDTMGDLAAWERDHYGQTAAEVSAVLLDHWRFSIEMVEAVHWHLDPTEAQMGVTGANLLNLACGIAEQAGAALPGEAMHWPVTPAKLERAGVTAEQCAACVEQTRAELERVNEAVNDTAPGADS
jgi:HD-like signal output (HDOD) protein